MREVGLIVVNHGRAIHVKVHAKKAVEINGIGRQDVIEILNTTGEFLHDVACHGNRMSRFKRGNGCGFKNLRLNVQAACLQSAENGIYVLDAIYLTVGKLGAGNGNQRNKVLRVDVAIPLDKLERRNTKVTKNLGAFLVLLFFFALFVRSILFEALFGGVGVVCFFGRLNWGKLLGISLAILANLELKVKLDWRFAKADRKNLVEIAEHFLFGCVELIKGCSVGRGLAEQCGVFAEKTVDACVHLV